MTRAVQLMAVCVTLLVATAGQTQAGVIRLTGEIRNIDGDGDGQVDDLKVSRIAFEVTEFARVYFDSLVYEKDEDLNGDGIITRFDSRLVLLRRDSGIDSVVLENDNYYNYDKTYGYDRNGSVTHLDPLIRHDFDGPGSYLIVIGQSGYRRQEASNGYQVNMLLDDETGNNSDWAPWTLDIRVELGSISNVFALDDPQGSNATVPEPASFVIFGIGACATAIGAARRRRRDDRSAAG